MQKGFRIAAMAGALSMVMGGVANAANHDLEFGGWSASGGQIEHSTATVCTSGSYDCSVVAAGDGFKQIQVSPSAASGGDTSVSYIMTIVADQNATGSYNANDLGFYDVSFVKMQMNLGGTSTNNENGIYSQQSIAETTGTGAGATSFVSTTDISTGWATAAASPVVISQSLVDNANTTANGDDFSSNFMYGSDIDANGVRTGFEMSIDQVAGLASAGQDASANDIQSFALRERQGTKLLSPGSITLGSNTASWAAGDDAKAIWLGQTINLDTQLQGANTLGSTFGYLSFDNVADAGTPPATEFGFAASNANGAWQWDAAAFNIGDTSTPCLADPSGKTC
jgi:hypothetical protein